MKDPQKFSVRYSATFAVLLIPPLRGYRYFITFTDDFSCYTHIGLCKSKDEALNLFKLWRAHAEKETSKSFKILHTDAGGEYTSMAFSNYLAKNRIKHELINPYTPQENGVSECANQTLNNLTQSMIADAREVLQVKSLPTSLWSQAIHHAAWIKNCTLSHSIESKVTPYQI